MKFDRLRLVGFKSFVEPTDFEIRPGLTGIVGPNGCGKSNLLESLRWVMGATSAKALRGGGMEDVIFSGTTSRPARNWAEVTLLLDNSARTLPAEYNESTEIEVTRRITRKTEGANSDYKINGKPVRAKDVQLLFADAATGANSPALVRQGQIAELIEAKPQNRRKLLEEAAGITGLYTRRHESELRLKAAETSLERLDDVTSELEIQRSALARQARQAKRYRNLSGYIREAEAMAAHLRWREATLSRETCSQELARTRLLLEEATRIAASASNAQSKAHETLDPLRLKEAEAAAALHRLEVEQENLEVEVLRLQKETHRLEEDHAQLLKDSVRERELGVEAIAAIDALNAEERNITARDETEAETLAEAETQHREKQTMMDAAQSEFDRINDIASTREAEWRSLTNTQNTLVTRLGKLRAQLDRAEGEITALKPDADEQKQLKNAEETLLYAEQQMTEAEETLLTCEAQTLEAAKAEEALRAPTQQLGEQLTALRAEAEAIVKMLHQSPYEESLPVIEEMTVEKGFEIALAAALGDDLNAPLDENATIYWSCISDTAHPDSPKTGPAPLPEKVMPLLHYVQAPKELEARLRAIGVVTPADGHRLHNLLRPGQRLVSREGDMWRWDGYVSRAEAKTPAAMRLEQRNRLLQLEGDIKQISDARNKAARQHETAKQKYDEARQADKDARLIIKNHEQTRRAAQQTLNQLETTRTNAAARHDALLIALDRLQGDLTECAQHQAQTEHAIAALPDVTRLQDDVAARRVDLSDARRSANESRLKYLDLKREQDTRTSRLEAIHTERPAWAQRSERAHTRLEEIERRVLEIKTAQQTSKDMPGLIENKRKDLFERLAAAGSTRRTAADTLIKAQTFTADADKALKAAEANAVEIRESKARLEARLEAAIEKVEEAVRLAHETCNTAPEGLLEITGRDIHDDLPERDGIDRQLEKYKAERERLGSVNLRADTEMEEIDTRLAEITAERDDCANAIRKLRSAINELNKEGRERLVIAFDTVNKNFQALFVQLFGGGEAELRLIDSDDPLEAGLEIYASPPGKKLTAMSLMSGGEQALTATALIFAVFMANPAPVCVLDEVDAALDDANTERFCNMLYRMADSTQTRFICITHHALTMSRMNRLYGVTMIERGISQLVSVDLSKATELVAAE